ncbi:GAF and ANTAR domain-containing protein [Amycolatopsis magusensis]|uniref:GAF and ANTAR domain-containing protein n=1 Tax=Amycolatopsis magusensis TaxID=882444 RepID=UPI00379CF0F7
MGAQRREHLRARLGGSHDAAEVLGAICDLCVTELAVTGARIRVLGPTTVDGGGATIHTTDALGALLDDLVTTTGAGPCLDAYALARPVLVPDLNVDGGARWPGFVQEALAAGVFAVFSFPLQFGGVRLGVLELHRAAAGSLTTVQLTDAFLLADVATDAIFHDSHGLGPMTLPELADIQAEVHQATGMVAVDLRVGLAEALLRIRGHAFARRLPLAQVAKDIIERRLRLDNGE